MLLVVCGKISAAISQVPLYFQGVFRLILKVLRLCGTPIPVLSLPSYILQRQSDRQFSLFMKIMCPTLQ